MATLGYRYRKIDNVIDELNLLKKLNKKEIFFIDQTFGISRKRLMQLCHWMIDEQLHFGWVCYSRVDVLDETCVAAMRQAGCHTIIFGVESASEKILTKYRKGYTKEQIQKAFRLCKKYKMRTVATFIMGLPEETEETAFETISFLKKLDCDFISLNIAVPRNNTLFRQEAIDAGIIREDMKIMDQSGSFIAMPTQTLSQDRVLALKRKAIMKFYLRPGYLIKRLAAVSSFQEFKEHCSEGWAMLKGM